MTIERECPVCESSRVSGFLRREGVPVHQNLLMRDQKSAVEITRGDLDLAFCGECGFVFNKAFDLSRLDYSESYDNTQSHSPTFDGYLRDLVRYMVSEKGVRGCRIVEVGCGKGSFLRELVVAEGANNSGIGFDPSYEGPTADLDGRLKFERRFYGPELAHIPADIVVCRHVIEHVPEPVELLRAIRQALSGSPHARVFFETPCVEWILRNRVIWDFFYEHCSYFTASSLATAFESSGFAVEDVRHVFGGQYLWLEAKVSDEEPEASREPGEVPVLAERFSASEGELKKDWRAKVRGMADGGKVALWGAGAKGVTLANLIDAQRELLDCVVDLNPQKQGRYLPGTGHPIIGYEDLAPRGVATAVLMNPNYRDENAALLKKANSNIELVEET